MLAIPLPFVASLLLAITAMILLFQSSQAGRLSALFVVLCALSTTVVGLRWTFDISVFRFLQPVFASLLPVSAFYCFYQARTTERFSLWHIAGPVVVTLCSFWYQTWLNLIDIILMLLFFGYGAILIFASQGEPEQVRLSHVPRVIIAERSVGIMLLISGCIDGLLSWDFLVYQGEHAPYILSLSYLFIIPAIATGVIIVGLSTCRIDADVMPDSDSFSSVTSDELLDDKQKITGTEDALSEDSSPGIPPKTFQEMGQVKRKSNEPMTELEAKRIIAKMDVLMKEQQAFRDPNLTLGRLARKLGIPARQVSAAVNQECGQNISRVLNTYRIRYAQHRLLKNQDSITEIFMAAGFQTKSNFNREFSRITGKTPSQYRRKANHLLEAEV